MSHRFTLGVEEEFQIVDPETWELRSHVTHLIESSAKTLGEQIKRELHQSIVEVGTHICADMDELRVELTKNREQLVTAAENVGLCVAAAGTHPFSSWIDQVISPGERYKHIVEELQQLARSLLIFGLHVHVAMPDKNTTIDLMNAVAVFPAAPAGALDELTVLDGTRTPVSSCTAPLSSGDSRARAFRIISARGASTENFVKLLTDLHCIDDGKKIWWDVRPHPYYGTLEFRVCDLPTRVEETIAIAALIQAIVVKLYKLYEKNLGFRLYRRALIEENKWRASRYGLDGNLIDFGKRTEVPMRDLTLELLAFVDDVLDELGSREEVSYVHTILAEGTSADRQLRVYRETGDLRAVVQHVVQETRVLDRHGVASKGTA